MRRFGRTLADATGTSDRRPSDTCHIVLMPPTLSEIMDCIRHELQAPLASRAPIPPSLPS